MYLRAFRLRTRRVVAPLLLSLTATGLVLSMPQAAHAADCTEDAQIEGDKGTGSLHCEGPSTPPRDGEQNDTPPSPGRAKPGDDAQRRAWEASPCKMYDWEPGAWSGRKIYARLTEAEYRRERGLDPIPVAMPRSQRRGRSSPAVFRGSGVRTHRAAQAQGANEADDEGEIRWVRYAPACNFPDGTAMILTGLFYAQVGADEPAPFDPIPGWRRAAYDAAASKIPPTLVLGRSPQGEVAAKGIVNLPSWFWMSNWSGPAASGRSGAVEVTVRAGALRVDPDGPGPLAEISCTPPGRERQPGEAVPSVDCTHRYSRAGSYPVTAAMTWTFSWTVNGGPEQPIPAEDLPERPGTVDRVTTVPYEVTEIQALNGAG
jgi:hypothetical protein